MTQQRQIGTQRTNQQHKQKHLTQVETLEEMFKKAKARVEEVIL